MTRRAPVVPVIICLLGLAVVPATAQIQVKGGIGHNSFNNVTDPPLSGDITNPGDLFLQHDLELGGELYLDGTLYMMRHETSPPDQDQCIYFARDGDRDGKYLCLLAGANDFSLNGGLRLYSPIVNAAVPYFAPLQIRTDGVAMYFLNDANADDDAGERPHTVTWYNNFANAGSRAMQLVSTGPPPDLGNLTIAGSLTQNGFDVAEMFLASERAEPGELVAVDDLRPDAVRPAVAGDGGRILGIVASEPGVILGGAAFSAEALRRQWGDEVADEFERERPALEVQAYARNPGLQDSASMLASEGAFAQALESSRGEASPRAADTGDDGSEPPTPAPSRRLPAGDELREAYAEALNQHETTLFDAVLELFQERRFARVALAGRVPVKVDAAFGAIEAGDPLTASPVPGVAMRAEGAGWIVGTALEAMPSGSGTILAFVDRGWIGGDRRGRLAELEDELETLKRALASLGLPGLELRSSLASRRRVGGDRLGTTNWSRRADSNR